MRAHPNQTSLALLALLAGCSALGLDDVERCDQHGSTPLEHAQACAQALNGAFGIPGWCNPWQCLDGECVRADAEICDGLDNDCDGVVDEDVFSPRVLGTASVNGTPSGVDGTSGEGAAWGRYANRGGEAYVLGVGEANANAMRYVRQRAMAGLTQEVMGARMEESGCVRLDVDRAGGTSSMLNGIGLVPTNCTFDLLDVEMVGSVGLGAAISTTASVDGELRVGHVDASEQTRFAAFGPSGLSNAFLGVARVDGAARSAIDADLCRAKRDLASSIGTCPGGCDAATERCLEGVCVPRKCATDGECRSPGLACGGAGICQPRSCAATPDCGGGTFQCVSSRCRQRCSASEDCGGESLACNSSNLCVPKSCAADAECAAGDVCACGQCLHPRQVEEIHACGVADAELAARAPSSAAGALRAEGLVTMVSGSRRRFPSDCTLPDLAGTDTDESLREVGFVGLTLHQPTTGAFSAVNATQEGVPERLGSTRSTTAPAALALDDGFLVGFANAEGQLALRYVQVGEVATPVLVCEGPGVSPATPPPGFFDDQVCCTGAGCVQPSFCPSTECGIDVGVCTSGRRACFGGVGLCEGATFPGVELCGNGLDDDCDGQIDETECAIECPGTVEVCNGIDDDCDGVVDEDVGGAVCGTDEGVCESGRTACIGGREVCVGGVRPAREVCGNGLDDDCNGTVDEAGCCTPNTMNDVCDGIDNDCDGVVDEDAPGETHRRCEGNSDCGGGRTCRGGFCSSTNNDFNITRDFLGLGGANGLVRSPEVIRQCIATDPAIVADSFVARDAVIEGRVEDLRMAVGPKDRDSLTVGVTWREVGESGQRVRFQMLTFHVNCTCRAGGTCGSPGCELVLTPTGLRNLTPTVTLATGAIASPTLVYTPAGILAEGAPRGEGTVSVGGGWYVAWRRNTSSDGMSAGRVEVRAVSAHDGQPANLACDADAGQACAITLNALGEMRFVDTFTRDGVPGLVSVGEERFVATELTCGM
ncbi:MAG: putative metal-binding motif-containing protein [Myxococcales bacterium]|nr:putative metal-binding motif-containing protein [Myxococcales bacterium]